MPSTNKLLNWAPVCWRPRPNLRTYHDQMAPRDQVAMGRHRTPPAARLRLCAHAQGHFPLPEIQAERILVADAQGAPAGEWPRSRWWQRYQDDQLDALVTRAIQDAPAMAVARERVKASQARAGLVKAATGPMVGLDGTVDRESVSRNGFLEPFYNGMLGPGSNGPW